MIYSENHLRSFRVKHKSAQKMEYVICKTVIAIGQFVNKSVNTYNYTMYSIHIPMTESLY